VSDDSDSVSPSRIDVMDNMRWLVFAFSCKLLFVTFYIRLDTFSLWYEAHLREISVDARLRKGKSTFIVTIGRRRLSYMYCTL